MWVCSVAHLMTAGPGNGRGWKVFLTVEDHVPRRPVFPTLAQPGPPTAPPHPCVQEPLSLLAHVVQWHWGLPCLHLPLPRASALCGPGSGPPPRAFPPSWLPCCLHPKRVDRFLFSQPHANPFGVVSINPRGTVHCQGLCNTAVKNGTREARVGPPSK